MMTKITVNVSQGIQWADWTLSEKNNTEESVMTSSLNTMSALLSLFHPFHLYIFWYYWIKKQRNVVTHHKILYFFNFKNSCARPCFNCQWHKSWLRINDSAFVLSRKRTLRIKFIIMKTLSGHLFLIMSLIVWWQNH